MQRHSFYADKLSSQSSAGSPASHLGNWFDVEGQGGHFALLFTSWGLPNALTMS